MLTTLFEYNLYNSIVSSFNTKSSSRCAYMQLFSTEFIHVLREQKHIKYTPFKFYN